MAPTAPQPPKRLTTRQKAAARLADPLLPRKLHRAGAVVPDGFLHSKRDKALIKRSVFASKVQKSYESARNPERPRRRRRRQRELVATLDALGDALGDIEAEIAGEDAEAMDAEQQRLGRTRPGALKRKEKMVREEMARLARNMALLTGIPRDETDAGKGEGAAQEAKLEGGKGGKGGKATRQDQEAEATVDKMATEVGGDQRQEQTQPTSSLSSRFAALRNYISSTMEQHPAFLNR